MVGARPFGSMITLGQLLLRNLARNRTVTEWKHCAVLLSGCEWRELQANFHCESISSNNGNRQWATILASSIAALCSRA